MQYNLQTINTSRAIELIQEALNVSGMGKDGSHHGMPIMLYGDAGCGKTYAFTAAAKAVNAQLALTSAMYRDPTDINGPRTIPQSDTDQYARHLWPDWAKPLSKDSPAIVVFDEVTKAPMATQNALYGSTQERQSDSFVWGDKWMPGFTGNLQTSKAGDIASPSPFRNRVAQYIVKNTAAEWLANYAEPNNLHYLVTSCIKQHAINELFPDGILNTWDPKENPAAFASERAWDNMAKICATVDDPRPWGYALLGEAVGTVFAQHCDLLELMPSLDNIRTEPDTCPVPDDIGIGYYIGNMISYWATKADMEAFAKYLRRMPSEVAATAMVELVKRHPDCKETAAYIQFRCDYKLTL